MRCHDVVRFNILNVAMVNALVIPQRIQTAVDSLANVTHRFSRWSHVNVLDVPLESSEGTEALIARLTAEIFQT